MPFLEHPDGEPNEQGATCDISNLPPACQLAETAGVLQEMWAKLKAPNPKHAAENGHIAKENGKRHDVHENGTVHQNGHLTQNGHPESGVKQNGHKPQNGMHNRDSSGSEDGSKISAVM